MALMRRGAAALTTFTTAAITAAAMPFCSAALASPKAAEIVANPGQALVLRQASTVQVRRQQGEALGSGVIVGSSQGGYWVATNRHVIQGLKGVCLITADRQSHPALVVAADTGSGRSVMDLAFLWFLSGSRPQAVVPLPAPTAAAALAAESLPLVVATGFPLDAPETPGDPSYQQREGLLLPLLRKPLEGGYGLAYTSLVEKGMSGGGLFWGTLLVGLNGVHSDPLWEGAWKQEDGRPLAAPMQAKLELVALAIPTSRILPLLHRLQAAPLPSPERLASVRCQGPSPATQGASVRSRTPSPAAPAPATSPMPSSPGPPPQSKGSQ